MDNEQDAKLNIDAIKLLDNSLLEVDSSFYDEHEINKKFLVQMYFESRGILRQHVGDDKIVNLAGDVFETCIRITRVAYLGFKEVIIDGKQKTLDAVSLYENAKKNFERMREQLDKRYI